MSVQDEVLTYRKAVESLESDLDAAKALLADACRRAWEEGVREVGGYTLTETRPARTVDTVAWIKESPDTYDAWRMHEMDAFVPKPTLAGVTKWLNRHVSDADRPALMDKIICETEGESKYGIKKAKTKEGME